jgi:hypothetical protein
MVEQEAVNFEVAGSSPAVGAKNYFYYKKAIRCNGFFVFLVCYFPSVHVEKIYSLFF